MNQSLTLCGLLVSGCVVLGGENPGHAEPAEDERALKEAGVATDGPGLLAFLRKQVLSETDKVRLAKLIEKLGDRNFREREKASAELKVLGPRAIPELRQALSSTDAEVRRRAQECIDTLEKQQSISVAAASVRLLMSRKPDGAAAVLLDYLPLVADENLEEDILEALFVLAVHNGKCDPVLAPALKDKNAAARGAAALVLGFSGSAEEKSAARPLLDNPNAKVRLRAAQGLAAGGVKNAIPTLLELLSRGPIDVARSAEDLLIELAAGAGPKLEVAEDEAARRKCSEAWNAWWKANEPKIDLARAKGHLFDSRAQAGRLAVNFLTAWNKSDGTALNRITAAPYFFAGSILKTQADVDNHFRGIVIDPNRKCTLVVMKVYTVPAYSSLKSREDGIDFLKNNGGAEMRVVFVRMEIPTVAPFRCTIFVRGAGARARVVGICGDRAVENN